MEEQIISSYPYHVNTQASFWWKGHRIVQKESKSLWERKHRFILTFFSQIITRGHRKFTLLTLKPLLICQHWFQLFDQGVRGVRKDCHGEGKWVQSEARTGEEDGYEVRQRQERKMSPKWGKEREEGGGEETPYFPLNKAQVNIYSKLVQLEAIKEEAPKRGLLTHRPAKRINFLRKSQVPDTMYQILWISYHWRG